MPESADISQTVNVGVLSSGDPANIRLTVSQPHIAVAGVGQVEQTTFKIDVLDDAGNLIDERSYENEALNNLRVSFATRPYGGEYITGSSVQVDSATGEVVKKIVDTLATGSIDIRTEGGSVNLNLQAGTLPGAVEIRVEALYDAQGDPLPAEKKVVASLPLVTIASGPPHTIVLTSPIKDSAINLGNGVYRRQGTAIVTDRYGNKFRTALPSISVFSIQSYQKG